MEADLPRLGILPRGLVVGHVNENLVCGICDGLLREPRHSTACDHTFCRVCYEAALTKEPSCPTCQKPVDASRPLQRFRLFEDLVKNTVVRCPNSAGAGGNISREPLQSRRTSGPDQSKEVDEEADDWGGSAPPRAHGVGQVERVSSPFDGLQVDAH
ncbi:hypothetical protein T484DRAFT_1840761 [Baffinella frigidus]|nr:hypothetical protein T484DRAFT_1840761 [Cryptophyta sp. CCMP2293]